MRPLTKALSFLSSFIFLASFAYCGTITGTVKGPDGTPFEGAFLQAQNTKTRITVNVLSDKDGRYRVENLQAGEYELRIRAMGYNAKPFSGVNLTSDQNTALDFALQKGTVRWSDLSIYQGVKLFPESKGKEKQEFVSTCMGCHGFQGRMAAVHRDKAGWRDRVNYMRDLTHAFDFINFTEQKAVDITDYVNTLFGENPVLPRSPADIPEYKDIEQRYGDEAMKIVYVEYELPGPSRMPWDANPGPDGKIWIPEYGPANRIARLDPKSGEVQEFQAPNHDPAFIHSAVEAPNGAVWFTEQSSNKIGRWDPKTQETTEYQDPYVTGKEGLLSGGSKHTLRIDTRGIVWSSGTPFSSFDPKSGKFDHYPVAPNTYGVEIDRSDNVWFDGFTPDGKLFKVDAKTRKITGYQPPTAGLPRRIQAAPDGIIWFAEYAAGKIGRFDPKTETFKEYQLPGAQATPYALGVDKNNKVWYSSDFMDYVGCLDPNTGKVTVYPFPRSENSMREFLPDSEGRMWFATPANNEVGYFYLAEPKERASK